MPRTIPRDLATDAMRKAWDRLIAADQRLEKYKKNRVGDRDQFVDDQTNAAEAYRRACRAAGHIGRNDRTKPPHLA